MPEVPFFFSDMLHLGPIIIYSRGVGVVGLVEFRFILKIVPPPPLKNKLSFKTPPPFHLNFSKLHPPSPSHTHTYKKKKKKRESMCYLPTHSKIDG